MKRAQAQQIFTWIIAIVLMSMLILFGYRSINSLRIRGEQARFLEFKNDLTNIIETTTDYGSERRVSLDVPGIYNEVCFVNTLNNNFPGLGDINDPIIKDSVESMIDTRIVNENVFLVKDVAEKSFLIENMKVDPKLLCVEVKAGKINFEVKGSGRYAEIKLWSGS